MADNLGKEYMLEVNLVLMYSLKKLCDPQCSANANNLAIHVTTITPFTSLKWSTNESYSLSISTDCKTIFYKKFKIFITTNEI